MRVETSAHPLFVRQVACWGAAMCVALAAGPLAAQTKPADSKEDVITEVVNDLTGVVGTTNAPSLNLLPIKSIDLRPALENWGIPIRLQGHRGTCSVFTMTAALEYALAFKERRATLLSMEFLNWASNAATGDNSDGSFFSDLWTGFEQYGICIESNMPYQQQFNPDNVPDADTLQSARAMRDAGFRMHWIKPWDRTRGLNEFELLAVKQVLARQWPVAGGFLWPKKECQKNNVLQIVPREETMDGHSVLLLGFRDDPNQPGGGVFIVRNYARGGRENYITYEYVRAYMNDAVWVDYDTAGKPVMPFPDLLALAEAPPAGRNHRVSSNEQPKWNDGDDDLSWLMPGQSAEMPLLKGPGVITHMWFTSHSGFANELDALVLRIYYDGSKVPGVEVPLGHFFGVGATPAVMDSIPVQVSPSGSLSCYWRMPFRKSARIVVTNDNPDRYTGLYWQVDYAQVDELPQNTPYFYAQYRQEYPAVGGRDYVLADLAGRGSYVGTVLCVTAAQDGWFGEGDDFFYIDGEQTPSLQGTGSEDYFNDAWGFRPRTSHWFGQPRWQGDRAGDNGIAYRWHLPDPIHFQKSLKVAIEHKGNCAQDNDGFFLERPDFISSVAFWYQVGEPKPFGEMPLYKNRCVPWDSRQLVKAFREAKVTGESKLQVSTTGYFGSRPVLTWAAKSSGDTLELPFSVSKAGRYAVRLTAGNGPEMGSCEILLDGRAVLRPNFREREESESDLALGTHELAEGRHVIAFKAGESRGPLVMEMLRLLPLPPEVKRSVRTDNEAHFVRLGIGRAVYAYRLAYDKLPDSLQTLVDSGIMPDQFMKDENGNPLKAALQDGYFCVESTAPAGVTQGGWKHRWQGLDARR